MGHRNDAALEFNQQAFEPLYRVQIEVVGGFIQQQNVGLRHQCLGQSHTFFGATRQRADNRLGVKVQAVQGFAHALLPVPAVQCFNFALHGVQITVAL
jgi:hypothetical protein